MGNTVKKNKEGYGYKYTDIAAINQFLMSQGIAYSQYIETSEINGEDYIYTVPVMEDGTSLAPRRGCRIPAATLSGKSNPAQEYGAALTYARRYSLLLAFGLATEDDDAECLTVKEETISAEHMNELYKELERTGISEEAILSRYKKKKIEYLTEDNFEKAMKGLQKSETKKEEN